MKRIFNHIILNLCCCAVFVGYGQTSVFRSEIESILHSTDNISSISEVRAGTEQFNFFTENLHALRELYYAEISLSSRREKYKIQHSEILEKLSEAATKAWKGSQYADKDKWNALKKHFKRAKLKMTTNFNLFETYSFTIPLTNAKGRKFHYRRNTPKGEQYLFFGKRKVVKNEETESEPLPFFTQAELIEKLMDKLNRNGSAAKIRKGIYRFVGISIELNERSLYKNAIPTARVVVFFGANRMQQVRV